MNAEVVIADRRIGPGQPVFVIAEVSANHGGRIEKAREMIRAARDFGADAVKLQTYTADTLTIPCNKSYFRIKGGTPWDGRTLYELYGQANTPWEWHEELKQTAEEAGIILFSSPFDATAVDFLEALDMPAYKIASFECVDTGLISKAASTGKPVIISTGMASLDEISDAHQAVRDAGGQELVFLKCVSSYPARTEDMHLRTIPDLAGRFQVPVGISDHTLGEAVPSAAVALGACVIEKHFTLSRKEETADSAFSMEPGEFEAMIRSVRQIEKACGEVFYGPTPHEEKSLVFRRSLFVVRGVKKGEILSRSHVRSIRPGYGMAPKFLEAVIGKKAARDLEEGEPLLDGDVVK